VIRFGLAIFDRQGTRRGYVLINFLAEHLLNKIRDIAGADHSLWLLDDQGEWLLGPEADRWSGQLPERRKRGFASVYPKAWAAIRQQVSGTLSVGGTRYQFARVSPLRSLIAMGDRVQLAAPIGLNDYHWLMLIGNSSASMAVTSHRLSGIAFDGGIAVALLVLVASSALAYAIARQRALANALEQAVDNVPVMVSYLDGEQRYRFNNRAYFQAYGITPKELYGKHVREVVGEDGYRQIQPRLDQAMTGQRVEFEIRREVGGRQRDLLTSYVPDMTADGQVLGLFVLISDITELKDSERRERNTCWNWPISPVWRAWARSPPRSPIRSTSRWRPSPCSAMLPSASWETISPRSATGSRPSTRRPNAPAKRSSNCVASSIPARRKRSRWT
jgi:PAS domain S-box-containing protein